MNRPALPSSESVVQECSRLWSEAGRVGPALQYLLKWLAAATGAEHVFLFALGQRSEYRMLLAMNVDGENLDGAHAWISHFAVDRAFRAKPTAFFRNASQDRRLRTEAEIHHNTRIQSVLVRALAPKDSGTLVYLHSRFHELDYSESLWALDSSIINFLSLLVQVESQALTIQRLERKVLRAQKGDTKAKKTESPIATFPRKIDFGGFKTCNPQLIVQLAEFQRLATTDLPILIEGESGTGKEIIARAIHAISGRVGPFVSLHCGAVPGTLVEIELFGYDKGAFTGAEHEREGLFESAQGGTLFLDDIGEMSVEMQNSLLRVLETGKYRPVSGRVEREIDVRVLSSNLIGADLMGGQGRIRHDLFFRLAGARLMISPLRDRSEDILLLADEFLQRYSIDAKLEEFSAAIHAAMLSYHWPGNARELENVIRRSLAFGIKAFDQKQFEAFTGMVAIESGDEQSSKKGIQSVVARAEREAIIRALREFSGNKSKTAKALGLSRKTLYRRMEKHKIPL